MNVTNFFVLEKNIVFERSDVFCFVSKQFRRVMIVVGLGVENLFS